MNHHDLPWEPNNPPSNGRTILIIDSSSSKTAADGNFILYALTCQYLSLNSHKRRRGAVVWISCNSTVERQIRKTVNVGSSQSRKLLSKERRDGGEERLSVIDIPLEMATAVIDDGDKSEDDFLKTYLRRLYERITTRSDSGDKEEVETLLVIDDLACFAQFFGEFPTYGFIQKLRHSQKISCLAIRCPSSSSSSIHVQNQMTTSWIGAGGDYEEESEILSTSRWELCFAEFADGIIDVVPLPHGFYSHDASAHGRIIFMERVGGRGWTDVSHGTEDVKKKHTGVTPTVRASRQIVNYCYAENGIKVTQLRSVAD